MFISYAQNFEDVILNRVFKDKNKGFYIDVGANHPVYDSITQAFYERGWSGINIEPMLIYYQLLEEKRSRDINLNCAISQQEQWLDFYDLQGTGYSTCDKTIAKTWIKAENFDARVYQVQGRSLASIANEYVNRPIDFLKIDVEGWEKQVVLSHDWNNFRPKVVIIEATYPGKPEQVDTGIEDYLNTQNYTKVYFDGLNDFYLAEEFSHLSCYFHLPPNVFDDFQRFVYVDLKKHANNLEQVVVARDTEVLDLKNELNRIKKRNVILRNYLEDEKFETRRLTAEILKLNRFYEKNVASLNVGIHRITEERNSLHVQNVHLEKKVYRLQEISDAIQSSKFWKLRKLWFKLKSKLGISIGKEII